MLAITFFKENSCGPVNFFTVNFSRKGRGVDEKKKVSHFKEI